MSINNYDECDAGIDGGCGACKKCDPAWWEALAAEEFRRGMLCCSGDGSGFGCGNELPCPDHSGTLDRHMHRRGA